MTPAVIGKLVVIGVGLIGGSFALALRSRARAGEIVGVGRSRANLETALARGIVDRALTLDGDWPRESSDADLVLVATPVAQSAPILAVLSKVLGPRTVVTDAGSTKQDVVAAARRHLGAALPRFVGAHPIAGSEQSGAGAAIATLFEGRRVILTPLEETDAAAIAIVEAAWTACGARVSTLAPEHHDRIFAAVSHLPHLLAATYLASLMARDDVQSLLDHAGSGFRDFTRIAAAPPELWRDIALANRAALQHEIANFRDVLGALEAALDDGDGAALESLLRSASDARRRWPGPDRQP